MPITMKEVLDKQSPIDFSDLCRDMSIEAQTMGAMCQQNLFQSVAPHFNDFGRTLKKKTKNLNVRSNLLRLTGNTDLVDFRTGSNELREILVVSHMTACAEIFSDWSFKLEQDVGESINRFLQINLARFERATQGEVRERYYKIHIGDSIRIMSMLKLLGLLPPKLTAHRLISFGAGSGLKEVMATQTEPKIAIEEAATARTYTFTNQATQISQLTLVDIDEFWRLSYERFEAKYPQQFLGLIEPVQVAFERLPDLYKERNRQPPNLVFGWRIDHEAIPDVKSFFTGLSGVIASSTRLIITIGAGHNEDEYAGRIAKMNEIMDYLKSRDLSPVKIIINGGGRDKPLFGYFPYATYEIIYCDIDRKKLLP